LRALDQTVKPFFNSRLKAKLAESHQRAAPAQHPNDDFLAPSGWKDRDADIQAA
jgi:hypothetical protein